VIVESDDYRETWQRLLLEVPEFGRCQTFFLNHHALREIVLGGSTSWRGVHERFQPFHGAGVLDIGANQGAFSVYCAFKGAHVVAYEPDPQMFQSLVALSAQDIFRGSLTPIQMAIWKQTGQVEFANHVTQDFDSLRYNGSMEVEELRWTEAERRNITFVQAKTFAEALDGAQWDCVKLDIEGAEYEVILSTAVSDLQKIKFMYLELHPWVKVEKYRETLRKLEKVFRVECAATDPQTGLMEAVYLTKS
jgi:FkbM family methyltransferase